MRTLRDGTFANTNFGGSKIMETGKERGREHQPGHLFEIDMSTARFLWPAPNCTFSPRSPTMGL